MSIGHRTTPQAKAAGREIKLAGSRRREGRSNLGIVMN
jgi:hypothetical protein